jgi:hypothetical protein
MSVRPDLLLDVDLHVHAELGRTRLPVDEALALGPGAIVPSTAPPTTPSTSSSTAGASPGGRLVVIDGEWCVRLEALDAGWAGSPAPAPTPRP